MRILFLSQFYKPEPVQKVHDLARGLVQAGHQVEVLTGFPCYPDGVVYSGYKQRLISTEQIDGVLVRRFPQLPDHSNSAFRRAIYYLSFAASASVLGTIAARRPDVILVYQAALPTGLAARVLSTTKRAPFVLDVVDLWPESVSASGMLTSRPLMSLLRRLAKGTYARASRISVVTPGFGRRLLADGVPPSKLGVIHNWIPRDTSLVLNYDAGLAKREGIAGKFVVMYAGNMGASQGLGTVIEAAELLRDEPDVVLALVGGGTEEGRLRARAAELGLTNVLFLGRRHPTEMPKLYAVADVLLVHLKPDELSDVTIPSKTFAYMQSGKPVLMAVRGDAADFVRENGFGVAVEPADSEALAGGVRHLKGLPTVELRRLGKASTDAYRTKYCGEVQIARFEQLLHAAAGRQR